MEEFEKFWEVERERGFEELCKEENLKSDEVEKVISTYWHSIAHLLITQKILLIIKRWQK
jgi:hypothetical protein